MILNPAIRMLCGIARFLLLCACYEGLVKAEVSKTNAPASDPNRIEVQFAHSAPYSTGAEVNRRMGLREVPPPYDVAKEKFEIILPGNEATNSPCGLLVWISPSDSPTIPPDWLPELAKQKLLFVGAYNTGNNRDPLDRFRLALDGAFNMSNQFKINPKRLYVGGFSGGGRVASMLGVTYADLFSGTLAICGVNFYSFLPAGNGQNYPPGYGVDLKMLPTAKQHARFVLVTGEKDVNRANTKMVYERGFKWGGFANVLYMEVPGMKHSLPPSKELNTALAFLDNE